MPSIAGSPSNNSPFLTSCIAQLVFLETFFSTFTGTDTSSITFLSVKPFMIRLSFGGSIFDFFPELSEEQEAKLKQTKVKIRKEALTLVLFVLNASISIGISSW